MSEFNHNTYMAGEFPIGTTPTAERSIVHLEIMTSFLVDMSIILLEKKDDTTSIEQLNAIYVLITNYKLRSITFINSFEFLNTGNGKIVFDEATPSILLRSMIENYLTFSFLFDNNDVDSRTLNFYLYELESLLHLKKSLLYFTRKNSEGITLKVEEVSEMIHQKINQILNHRLYNSLDHLVINNLRKVKNETKNYLKIFTFEDLIKKSNLPSELIINEYSHTSSFVHSQLYGLKVSHAMFGKSENQELRFFELSKFRLLVQSLYLTSEWISTLLHNFKIEVEDEYENKLNKALSLSTYYHQALQNNS